MKVLITRTDRLGDLVLALPVVDFLRRVRPHWQLQMLVAPGLEAVVEGHPGVENVRVWSDSWPARRCHRLQDELAASGISAVLMLQYRRELALLLRKTGTGKIFGPRSKFSSWFLLQGGKSQGRSRSSRHEVDLNLELAGALAGLSTDQQRQVVADVRRPRVHLTRGQRAWGETWRQDEVPGSQRIVFIHPGSGGSALDWGPERFAAVAGQLARRPGTRVFVTGAAADACMVKNVAAHLDPRVKILLERFTLSQFMGVLAQGDVMVAPSTGPLHLAAAVGVPTVGLFPPAPVMSPGRWGQRGEKAVHLLPDIRCPAKRRCALDKCTFYNCLEKITPAEVVGQVTKILADLRTLSGGQEDES